MEIVTNYTMICIETVDLQSTQGGLPSQLKEGEKGQRHVSTGKLPLRYTRLGIHIHHLQDSQMQAQAYSFFTCNNLASEDAEYDLKD